MAGKLENNIVSEYKMKTLLIRYHEKGDINTRLPKSLNKAEGIFPPLGIATIAAYLEKKSYEAEILDIEALNLTSQESKQAIQKSHAAIVGITSMTSTFKGALEAAKFAKESGAIVVIGGPQVNAFPKESVNSPSIDYGMYGEGEEVMLELIKAIESKKSLNDIRKIRGLIYKKGSKIFVNEPAIFKNLDELPMPAWHLLPMRNYHCVISESPFITIMTSRGCPFQCGFCFKQPTDNVYRVRSPKKIVDEIEYCLKRYKIKEAMFYDDTLTLNRKHIEDICHEIIRRKIKIRWEGPTRIDCVDENLLRLMKKAGCIRLRYGIESGDERILELMKKGINRELAKKVFRLSEKVGIETFAYFIIGYYSDTPESMQRTINFAKELDADWAMFTIATPYPQTNLLELAVKGKLIDKDYWLKFVKGEKVGRMPYLVKDAEKWAKRAYLQFYFRPRFIIKKIMKLTSVEVLKNYLRGAKAIMQM